METILDIDNRKYIFSDFVDFITNKPHSITIEKITTQQQQNLYINYSFQKSYFGNIIIASTQIGICYIAFIDDPTKAVYDLKKEFKEANFSEQTDVLQKETMCLFENHNTKSSRLRLHIKGTDFQIKIWKTLLRIPFGSLCTYQKIAFEIENPKSQRAVGNAVARNPVAFIIPCHRVIKSSGTYGNYRWGNSLKIRIIDWESSMSDKKTKYNFWV